MGRGDDGRPREVAVRSYWLDDPDSTREIILRKDSWEEAGAARIGWKGSVHVVAWTAMESTLRVARIDPQLRRAGADLVVAGVHPTRACALSHDGRWVAWRSVTGMIRVSRLDDDGALIGSHLDVAQSFVEDVIGLASDGETALLAWPTRPSS